MWQTQAAPLHHYLLPERANFPLQPLNGLVPLCDGPLLLRKRKENQRATAVNRCGVLQRQRGAGLSSAAVWPSYPQDVVLQFNLASFRNVVLLLEALNLFVLRMARDA